jgi:N-acetylmuramoyl-L-alanine amidase
LTDPDALIASGREPEEDAFSMHPRLTMLAVALVVSLVGGVALAGETSANDRVVIVQPGDTLSQIALEQGVSVADLVALNGLADPHHIVIGQRLRIRGGDASTASRGSPTRPHLVAWGETLTSIARRYDSTIEAIVQLNDITNPSFIRAGSVLRVPSGGSRQHPPRGSGSRRPPLAIHIVAWGENLTVIARRYGTTVESLARLNGLPDPSFVRAGAALRVPVGPRSTGAGRPADERVTLPAEMAALVASRESVRRLIVAEAQRQGVPPAFALAVAWQESGWQQGVISGAGAIGVMQLLPATAEWVGAAMLGEPVHPYDLASNVQAGVRLLRHYLDRYGGSRALALAAYYQGQASVDAHGIYPVSGAYIASILRLTELFSGG